MAFKVSDFFKSKASHMDLRNHLDPNSLLRLPQFFGDKLEVGGGGCGCSFFSIMSFIPAVPRHHPPPRLSIRTSLACLLPHLPCSPNTCRQSTRHRIANAHLLCHPLDSANCLGWGTHTAFLRPAESRELCLCVLIGFLGYGTRDG